MARPEEFVRSEAQGFRSREVYPVAVGALIESGTPIGLVTVGAQSVAAAPHQGNTGNGAMTALTADTGAAAGVYVVAITAAAANGGNFSVTKPDSTADGVGTVGAAYNGAINFTLADGAADFAVGDRIDVTVAYAAGSGTAKAVTAGATDGSAVCVGLALRRPELGQVVAMVRDLEVESSLIPYAAGTEAAVKAALAPAGVVFR